jgi:hypothetical protein
VDDWALVPEKGSDFSPCYHWISTSLLSNIQGCFPQGKMDME